MVEGNASMYLGSPRMAEMVVGETVTLEDWHRVIEAGNTPADLAGIIREDAVFHSPVVHTPQQGRAIVVAYLAAAGGEYLVRGGKITTQNAILNADTWAHFAADINGMLPVDEKLRV